MLSQVQVSQILDVGLSTLRRYVVECEDQLSIRSRRSNGRHFTEADVMVLRRQQTRTEQQYQLTVTCAWCGEEMGSRPGVGVSGHSHGMCSRCAESFLTQYESERALAAG